MTNTNTDRQDLLLSILIPVYNERSYLRKCVERVVQAPLPPGLRREVIIVDDASTDGTKQVVKAIAAQHPETVKAFFQEVNQGKGAAIRRAIQEMSGDYVVFQDADLEYDPAEYPALLKPILLGHADVVYGSRFIPREMCRVLNYHHSVGNRLLTTFSNILTGLNLTDMETCYKAFRSDVLKTIPIRSNRFGIEPEITAKIAKRACIVYEVPISYYGRTYSEGKKINWKDGVSAIYTCLKYWAVDDCFEERYGHEILANFALARRFNRWMSDMIAPHLGERICEIGSGIGNISRFLPKKELLTVTDNDPVYINLLKNAFRNYDGVTVAKADLTCDADFDSLERVGYDSVVCLNVLEHIEDDKAALLRMKRILQPDGRIILLVPQHKWLYGTYDANVGHCRRYSRAELEKLLDDAGFVLESSRGFNFVAMFGWWLNAVLLKRQTMSKVQMKFFDLLVPFMRLLESVIELPGISIICIAKRKQ